VIELAFCLVVAISDGDTLNVRCGEAGFFQQQTVRLAEIDAPEKGQPFARRSTASLAALCFGAWASISPEREIDTGEPWLGSGVVGRTRVKNRRAEEWLGPTPHT